MTCVTLNAPTVPNVPFQLLNWGPSSPTKTPSQVTDFKGRKLQKVENIRLSTRNEINRTQCTDEGVGWAAELLGIE